MLGVDFKLWLFLFLISFPTPISGKVKNARTATTCPARKSNVTGIYYVTENPSECDWGYYKPGTPTTDIVGSFRCSDDCFGMILNPDYVFWDSNRSDYYSSPPSCPVHNISSCTEIGKVCQTDKDYSCGRGRYVCQPLIPTEEEDDWCLGNVVPLITTTNMTLTTCPSNVSYAKMVDREDALRQAFPQYGVEFRLLHWKTRSKRYHVYNDYFECFGDLIYTGDECPPDDVVTGKDELEQICSHTSTTWSAGSRYADGQYNCYMAPLEEAPPCSGIINHSKSIPDCFYPNITSCDDHDYYFGTICETHYDYFDRVIQHCNDNFNTTTLTRNGNFTCMDKVLKRWCKGNVVPTGVPTIAPSASPSMSIHSNFPFCLGSEWGPDTDDLPPGTVSTWSNIFQLQQNPVVVLDSCKELFELLEGTNYYEKNCTCGSESFECWNYDLTDPNVEYVGLWLTSESRPREIWCQGGIELYVPPWSWPSSPSVGVAATEEPTVMVTTTTATTSPSFATDTSRIMEPEQQAYFPSGEPSSFREFPSGAPSSFHERTFYRRGCGDGGKFVCSTAIAASKLRMENPCSFNHHYLPLHHLIPPSSWSFLDSPTKVVQNHSFARESARSFGTGYLAS